MAQGGKAVPSKTHKPDRHINPDFKFRIAPRLDEVFRETAARAGLTLQAAAHAAFADWVARRRLAPCPGCGMISGIHLEQCPHSTP